MALLDRAGERAGERLRLLRARHAERAVEHEERHAADPVLLRLTLVGLDRGRVLVRLEGTNDTGRTMQLVFTMTNGSGGTSPAEIREIKVNYDERPTLTPAYQATIRAVDYVDFGGGASRATGKATRAALLALAGGDVVTIVDPWGDSFTGRITIAQAIVNQQFAEANPMEDVTVQIRRLDYS